MRQGEYITDHEVKIGTKVAEVLCGGNVTPGTPVSEQYILDLEREAFQVAVRREEDAGADSVHIEDGEDAEELRTHRGSDEVRDRYQTARNRMVAAGPDER